MFTLAFLLSKLLHSTFGMDEREKDVFDDGSILQPGPGSGPSNSDTSDSSSSSGDGLLDPSYRVDMSNNEIGDMDDNDIDNLPLCNFPIKRRTRHPTGNEGFANIGLSESQLGSGTQASALGCGSQARPLGIDSQTRPLGIGSQARPLAGYSGCSRLIPGYNDRVDPIGPIPAMVVHADDGRRIVEFQNPNYPNNPPVIGGQGPPVGRAVRDQARGEGAAAGNNPNVRVIRRRFPREDVIGMDGRPPPPRDSPIRQIMTAFQSFMALLKEKYKEKDYERYENILNLLISMKRGVGIEAKAAMVLHYLEGDEELIRQYKVALPKAFIENASPAELAKIGRIAKRFSEEREDDPPEAESEEEAAEGAVGYANPFAHIPDTDPPVEESPELPGPSHESGDKPEKGRRRRPSKKQ